MSSESEDELEASQQEPVDSDSGYLTQQTVPQSSPMNNIRQLEKAQEQQLAIQARSLLPAYDVYLIEELKFNYDSQYNPSEEFAKIYSGKFQQYLMKAQLPPDTRDFYSLNGIGELEMNALVGRRQRHLNRIDDNHSLLITELCHPNILRPVCLFGTSRKLADIEGALYEDVAASLENYVTNCGSPAENETIIRWTLQMASALDYCHTKLQLMARAINPTHVFVFIDNKNEASLKLGGLIFAKKSTKNQHTTSPNPWIHFCAPETLGIAPIIEYDYFSDIWSLGCLIYYFIHGGQVPYDRKNGSEKMKKEILKNDPRRVRSDVDPALKEVIEACLRKRYPTDGINGGFLAIRPSAETIIEHLKISGYVLQ